MKKGITIKAMNLMVIGEATKLKANATKKERSRLDFDDLKTANVTKCVYGQMTGNCHNSRAIDLIVESCERVFKNTSVLFGRITGELNGAPVKRDRSLFWSPIEIFIDTPRNKENGNNKRLIAFIKGETDVLKLK